MSAIDIVIASAKRTAVGSFNGAFANTPAHELGAVAVKAAIEAAGLEPAEVDEVILGQILSAAQGQNPARQAAMKAGVPQEKTAFGVNQLCGSGLRAVALGLQQIANGDAEIIVAGGQELMSLAPHAALSARRREDGRDEIPRHHAQGRADRRLPRLSHGNHRGEHRRQVADQPRGAGPFRRRFAEQGGSGAEGRPLQGRDRPGDRAEPQGRRRRRRRRIHPRRRDLRRRRQAAGPPSPRTAR